MADKRRPANLDAAGPHVSTEMSGALATDEVGNSAPLSSREEVADVTRNRPTTAESRGQRSHPQNQSPTPSEKGPHHANIFDDYSRTRIVTSLLGAPLAGTVGPIANVFSLTAAVTPWRAQYTASGRDIDAVSLPDPKWGIALNSVSLACAMLGTCVLLGVFSLRLRATFGYLLTTVLWLISTALLIADIAAVCVVLPLTTGEQTFSQGFWYAVIAVVLYIAAMAMLGISAWAHMTGKFLIVKPHQRHAVSVSLRAQQRSIIFVAVLFSFWWAIWAAIFHQVSGLSFADALFFCVLTMLTIGFGGFVPPGNAPRALVIPLSVIGIFFLGALLGGVNTILADITEKKFAQQPLEKKRLALMAMRKEARNTATIDVADTQRARPGDGARATPLLPSMLGVNRLHEFMAIREIQEYVRRWKVLWSATIAILVLSLIWLIGAVVIWRAEASEQGFSFFDAFFLCFVALLTIGNGNVYPTCNAGKPFFVIWSLLGTFATTMLIGNVGYAFIISLNSLPRLPSLMTRYWTLGTIRFSLWKGRRRGFRKKVPIVTPPLPSPHESFDQERSDGAVGPVLLDSERKVTNMAENELGDEHEVVRQLVASLRSTFRDVVSQPDKNYSFEQWARLFRLLRFEVPQTYDKTNSLVNWDWVGDSDPAEMGISEPNWILGQLIEKLAEYVERQMKLEEERAAAVKNALRSMGTRLNRDNAHPHPEDGSGSDGSGLH